MTLSPDRAELWLTRKDSESNSLTTECINFRTGSTRTNQYIKNNVLRSITNQTADKGNVGEQYKYRKDGSPESYSFYSDDSAKDKHSVIDIEYYKSGATYQHSKRIEDHDLVKTYWPDGTLCMVHEQRLNWDWDAESAVNRIVLESFDQAGKPQLSADHSGTVHYAVADRHGTFGVYGAEVVYGEMGRGMRNKKPDTD